MSIPPDGYLDNKVKFDWMWKDWGNLLNPCREIVLPGPGGASCIRPASEEKEFEEAGGFAAELTSANVENMVWKGSAGEEKYKVVGQITAEFEPHSEFERTMLAWMNEPVEEPQFSEETCETVHSLMSAPVAWDPHSGLEDPRS